MPTKEELEVQVRQLSNEELIDRLRAKVLTTLATDITRKELAARGIDVERAVSEQQSAITQDSGGPILSGSTLLSVFFRTVRFPVQAVLGNEPLWMVFVVGGIAVYSMTELIASSLARLHVDTVGAVPAYAAPLSYFGVFVVALAFLWLSIALWRTGRHAKTTGWRTLARLVSLACAIEATWFTYTRLQLIYTWYYSANSILDLGP